ncbi:hypothetical protein AAMO2058_000318900 [Amorphochlora amoebiformis]
MASENGGLEMSGAAGGDIPQGLGLPPGAGGGPREKAAKNTSSTGGCDCSCCDSCCDLCSCECNGDASGCITECLGGCFGAIGDACSFCFQTVLPEFCNGIGTCLEGCSGCDGGC